MNERQLRWRGGVAAALVLATAGVAAQNGAIVFAAAVPLVYVAYASVSGTPSFDEVRVTRTVDPQPAPPGRVVDVTLTVRNESNRSVPDVRVADGVPEEIAVVEGSPRAVVTLEPDEELTVDYTVIARRGEYDFAPPHVRTRGLGASGFATLRPEVDGDQQLVCRLDADAPPIAQYGHGVAGTVTSNEAGEGVSFHSIREYRGEDPASRIDWRHYAKRGELATINYERDVPTTVVVVLDAAAPNEVVAGPGRPTAIELQAYAATRALSDLLGTGNEVGVAVLGLEGPGPDGLHWLPPGGGSEQRSLALDAFRTATEASVRSRDRSTQVRRVLELAPRGAQIALCSPLLDSAPVAAVETWLGADVPVTVLSADVVAGNTVAGQLTQVRRRTRLARCQAAGARTFDWRRGTPLPVIIDRAFAAEARTSTAHVDGGGS